LRARTKNGWFPLAVRRSRKVGRITNVTQPSAPVTCSGGVVVLPNGMPTTNTTAPCTGWFWLSVTRKRAVNGLRERMISGMNCTRSMMSRFGSETSVIEIVCPLGTDAFVTTPVGVVVAEREPRLFRAVTRKRSA
jgi:hypothetical protein